MIVTMHFGDGTYKQLDMTSDDPDEAAKEARDWVESNAWFVATDEKGNESEEVHF